MDNIGPDSQVVIDEFGRVMAVRPDAADPGGGQKDIFRTFGRKESAGDGGVTQVKLPAGTQEQVVVAFSVQFSNKRRADESRMPGNVYFRILFHAYFSTGSPGAV